MKKAVRILMMLVKPLLNQRGLAGEEAPDPDAVDVDENGFIAGTNYKSVQDLIRGHGELKNKFDAQGNELGQVRGQAHTLAEAMKEFMHKGNPDDETRAEVSDPAATYEAKAGAVGAKLEELDPLDENFAVNHGKLVKELTKYTAMAQHEKTLAAAGSLFQQELSVREAAKAQKQFLTENPQFVTEEMQWRINDFLANDSTGMHDEISAFFKLQADDNAEYLNSVAAENAEMRKILELQHGKDSTGRVITKGQTPQPARQPIATGKDLNNGMAEVLRKIRGEA
jgi:hypothetical protein